MPDKQPNSRRPTSLEDEAHRATIREFSDQIKQFSAAQSAVGDLEKNALRFAKEAGEAARNHSPIPVVADDGNQWNMGRELMDKVHLCHRSTASGVEFAIVERLDMKSQVSHDVLAQGSKADEILRDFAKSQRAGLRLWTDDFSAQVREHLALKYPGQDLSRVVEAINHRLTESRPHRHSIKSGEAHKPTGEVTI